MTTMEKFYETQADTLINKLSFRGMEGYYVATKEDALQKALRFIAPGSSVSWGGSATLSEIGFFDAVKNADCTLLDRTVPVTPDEKDDFFSKVAVCDYYFMSTNAITIDGQLINIDGTGNRMASLIHGPKNIIIIAGMNKVCANVESAYRRIKISACPPNATRLDKKTPCALTGRCTDCMSPDCICTHTVITRRSNIPNRIKIILVGETLGY